MTATDLTRLCATDELSEDEPLRVEVGDMAYAVFQVGDDYFVTADLCSHGPGSLSEGFVVNGCEVECPFHQGRFDLRSGAPTYPPCEVAIRVWDAILRDGDILIAAGSPKGA
jgi:anthranilate 1,2-dioxygenase ferredoxin subunit